MENYSGHHADYFKGLPEYCPIHPPEHPMLGDTGKKLTAEETVTRRDLFVNRMLADSYYVWRKRPDTPHTQLYEVHENEQGLYMLHGEEKICFAHKHDGYITEMDPNITNECEMTIGDPVAPWGSRGSILMTHIGRDPVFAPYDLPPDLKTQVIDVDRAIQQLYFHHAKKSLRHPTVSTGINFGAAGIDNLGLQTMIHYHKQIYIPGPQSDSYTHEEIIAQRNNQQWDHGVSFQFAQAMQKDLYQALSPYKAGLEIVPDQMGFSIALSGFTPDNYDEQFVELCMKPVAFTIHEYLRDVYKILWGRQNGKDMKDIIWHLYQAQFHGLDRQYYNEFFPKLNRDEQSTDNESVRESVQQLRPALLSIATYENEKGNSLLRKPPGWAFLLNYTDDTALLTATFGFLNKNMGPVEGGGITLQRPKEELTPQKRKELTSFNKSILQQACASYV